ncbi:PEP/pyruvate-binding domain-containing protein [Acrocarpospora sp. B8E8]|uniref:PEP/pyruvate-binding domain-containing protein n=1 Tax=Acrocarpospora sp. B8E8 TaxID=3153572 RepID=UPI00325EB6A7
MIGLTESQAADPMVVGTKFARLASIHSHTEIPPAWCIGSHSFVQALGTDRLARLTAIMHDLTVTLGCDLAALPTQLQAALAGLSLPADVLQGLAALVADENFAVRSSTEGEDGHQHSYAGLYESYLRRRGLAEVADAVVACWRSYYSPRAVLARLRAGDVNAAPRMGVIVQHMVDADLAGVAFTRDSQVWVSATIGTGEQLVDGSTDAATLVIRSGEAPPPYDRVAQAATGLKSCTPFGAHTTGQASRAADDIDLEWAWTRAHGLRILQVRPVTAALPGSSSPQPHLASAPLYTSGGLPENVRLGACADLYGEMTAKRSALFALATEHGFTVSDGLIITLNGAGLADHALPRSWDRWLGQQPHLGQEVVIDAGARIRQNIARKTDIESLLGNALNLAGDPYALHTVLIRRFVRGCAGALTQQRTDGRILLQQCPEGLVALNRGLAVPTEHLLPEPSHSEHWQAQPPIGPWGRQTLQRMA